MKLNDKLTWDQFIYNLIYPGMLGSMIYDLFYSQQPGTTVGGFFSIENSAKLWIILFYCVDYLHLYGDMHKEIPTENRGWVYYFCDLLSSFSFFAAFVMVKFEHFALANLIVILIPFLFLWYKWKLPEKKGFLVIHSVGGMVLGLLLCLFLDAKWALSSFTFVSFLWYAVFVFILYERSAKLGDNSARVQS